MYIYYLDKYIHHIYYNSIYIIIKMYFQCDNVAFKTASLRWKKLPNHLGGILRSFIKKIKNREGSFNRLLVIAWQLLP